MNRFSNIHAKTNPERIDPSLKIGKKIVFDNSILFTRI